MSISPLPPIAIDLRIANAWRRLLAGIVLMSIAGRTRRDWSLPSFRLMPRLSEALAYPLAHLRQGWEAESTLKNLRAIAKVRQAHSQSIDSMQEALANWRSPPRASHPTPDRQVAIAPSKSPSYRFSPIYVPRFMGRNPP